MCGIAGILGGTATERELVHLRDALHLRGPDEQGRHVAPGIALVHARLRVLDLAATGAQPMTSPDGKVTVVFNGEIYNHRELRRELEAEGHRLHGSSDTEILPLLYQREGRSFLARLRGMFALGLWDLRRGTLLLARDRFGIKPLFWGIGGGRLAFASNLTALRRLEGLDTRPDPQAISDLAALLYVPAPRTLYRGLRALEPGCVLEARADAPAAEPAVHRFHVPRIPPRTKVGWDEAVDRVDALVQEAVQAQLESDVPLAALVSGGIDSSLVAAAAAQASARRLSTFNLRFSERGYDETWAARLVVDRIGSHHTSVPFETAPPELGVLDELLLSCGQPFADTSLFAVDALALHVRRSFTVALSGDGGDEAFGGYRWHRRLGALGQLRTLPPELFRGGVRASVRALSLVGRLAPGLRYLPARVAPMEGDDDALVASWFCAVEPEEHARLVRDRSLEPVKRLFARRWPDALADEPDPVERLAAHATEASLRVELPNDFLFKVDTGSMRHGLEVRVPMLDERLVEFGLSLPHAWKADLRRGKRILRAVAARHLPSEVVTRRKQGFSAPIDRWLSDGVRVQMAERVLAPGARLNEFLDPAAFAGLLRDFAAGRPVPTLPRSGVYGRAVMLYALELFLGEA